VASADSYFIKRSLMIALNECGDTGVIVNKEDTCFLALVDVLGHGKDACDLADLIRDFLTEHHEEELTPLLQALHEHIKGTRGAVAAVGRLNTVTGELRHAGVGNITTRIFGANPFRFLPKDGVIGYMMPRPIEQTFHLAHRDVLMMYSDGVKTHFDLHDCPDLLLGDARDIAEKTLRTFGKNDDDASCLVLRYI